MVRIGFIGYGYRIGHVFDFLKGLYPECEIAAIADPNQEEVKKRLGDDVAGIEFFNDADEMLKQAEIDAVMIGTRCSLHARMAAKVAERKLPLFLEKPVATTMEDLKAMYQAFKKSGTGDKVVVSFPLRLTRQVQLAKEMIDAGVIGTLEHVQAVNNVPYGGQGYFMGWYRDWDETHGLWLQKATHDLDDVTYLLGRTPVRAAGMMSQRVLGPAGKRSVGFTMPMEQTCEDCTRQEECPESSFNSLYMRGEGKGLLHEEGIDHARKPRCMFGDGIKNQDNGSALVEYEDGAQAVYSQNFFTRREAEARGAILFGYKGTIKFDWDTNEFTVVHHHVPRVEKIEISARDGHGGGDIELVRTFFKVIRDGEPSRSNLHAGMQSALLCMKVAESCRKGEFVKVDMAELE